MNEPLESFSRPRLLTRPLRSLAIAAALACAISAGAQDDDPPAQAGRLSVVMGEVSVQPAQTEEWGQAYPNLTIALGDRLYTGPQSRAEVQIGRTFVRLGPNSDVTLTDYNPVHVTFDVGRGSVHVHSYGLWEHQFFSVQTPSGTITVNTPAEFRADVDPDQPEAVFTDLAGPNYVAGAGGFGVGLSPSQSLQLVGSNPVYPQWLDSGDFDELDQWSQSRDQQMAASESERYVNPEMGGAADLDHNGDWRAGTEYGAIWFPHVDQNWQPYHNGHWMNRQPWGWVWVEDESWGYAPFHYGRWVNYEGRWGWVPGPRESHSVWSPALVVFAGVGGGETSAWFPLGPGEAYRPWYRCSPRYVDQVNISNISPAPRVRVQNTYVNVVNVNITNITYVNQTRGVTAVSRQDFSSGRSVAQASVRVTPQQMQHVQVVARPQVEAPARPVISRPVAHAVPLPAARPVVINSSGEAVAAQAHAKPQPAPVHQPTAAPQPPPGHKAIAPPANVNMTPAAQKAMQAAPPPAKANQPEPARPASPAQPVPPAQLNRPGTQPAAPANQPGHPAATPARPEPQQQARPAQPGARPGAGTGAEPQPHPAQPTPPARPMPAPQRPAEPQPRPAQPTPPVRPAPQPARPTPQPERPVEPQPRPAEPQPHPAQPAPPVRPTPQPERPTPPPARPAEPQPHPAQPVPPVRPTPQPERPVQPQPHPAPPPPARPDPQTRPAPPPAHPDARPAPAPKDKPKDKQDPNSPQ